MGVGKVLVLIGGLLTLVSTFSLSFYGIGGDYSSDLGFIFNNTDIMANPGNYVTGETMTVYIVAIVYIVFLISGVLQLAGLASRVVAIIGSILPIVISVLIILMLLGVLDLVQYTILFFHTDIINGILPYHLPIGSPVSLGTYTLLASGVLGLIGGILGTKDEY